ncbi:MAG: hypothetical protein H6715_06245 [Myxococcales bacterium]|nr:hypothetical protein [Myxococcales bacterium]
MMQQPKHTSALEKLLFDEHGAITNDSTRRSSPVIMPLPPGIRSAAGVRKQSRYLIEQLAAHSLAIAVLAMLASITVNEHDPHDDLYKVEDPSIPQARAGHSNGTATF